MTYLGPVRHDLKVMIPHFKLTAVDEFRSNIVPIIGLDPGGTTGWSLLVIPRKINGRDVFSHNQDVILSHKLVWEHGEIGTLGIEDEAVYQLSKLIFAWPEAAVVVEDFILRAERKEKSRELLSPVRLTAKLETYLWRAQRKIFLQSPSEGKGTQTDAHMKAWNVLAEDGLPDHARDADRHVIHFLRRCMGVQGVKVKRSAWPHIYATEEENTTGMVAKLR